MTDKDEINKIKIVMQVMQKDIEFIKEIVKDIKTELCEKADKKEVDIIKKTVEKLKAFRWQMLAGGVVVLWLFESFKDKLI